MEQPWADIFPEMRFRRNPLFGVLWLIGTLVWLSALVLKWIYNIGALSVPLYIPVVLLFIVNTLWSFSAPYIILKAGTVTVRQGLLNVKTFRLEDVKSIESIQRNFQVSFSSGRTLKLHTWVMEKWQREKLHETFRELTGKLT